MRGLWGPSGSVGHDVRPMRGAALSLHHARRPGGALTRVRHRRGRPAGGGRTARRLSARCESTRHLCTWCESTRRAYPPGWYGASPPGPYAGYGYYPVPQQTNSYAIAALVLSIVSLCGIGSVLGIIFGLRARREIAASGGMQTGDGMALAGIIVGAVTLGLVVLYFVFIIVMMFVGANAAP